MSMALVLIDIQNDYFKDGKSELFHAEEAAGEAKRALSFFRAKGLPVLHVQHINTRQGASFFLPETVGAEIHESVYPGTDEIRVIKDKPDSFFDTDLQSRLEEKQIRHLVVCGMMSHMCIDTTVRAAKRLGYEVTVLSDACTTKDLIWDQQTIPAKIVHRTFMAALQGAFADVKTTSQFIGLS